MEISELFKNIQFPAYEDGVNLFEEISSSQGKYII